MTVSIALVTKDCVVTATDRRLTSGAKVLTEEQDKTCTLFTADSTMAVSFSGLASVGTFDTHEWMLKSLNEAAPDDYLIEPMIDRFSETASTKFRTDRRIQGLMPQDKRVSFLFAGYVYRRETYLPSYGLVTNFEKSVSGQQIPQPIAFQSFEVSKGYLSDLNPCVTVGIGQLSTLSVQRIVKLRKDAHNLKPKIIAHRLAMAIQIGSRSNTRGAVTVGEQVTTSIIFPDQSAPVDTQYHSGIAKRETFMPAMVLARKSLHMTVSNISIAPVEPDSSLLVVPSTSRNKPCPCGSGKKYKKCHGGNT